MSFYLPNDYVSPFISANYSSPPTSAEQYFTSPATPQFYTPSQVANQVWNSGGYWSQILNTPDLMNSTKAYANNLANTFAYGVQTGDMDSAQAAYTQLKNISANPYSYRDSSLPTNPSSFGLSSVNTAYTAPAYSGPNTSGLLSVSGPQPTMPADETALRSEYGIRPSDYTGASFDGSTTFNSAYNAPAYSGQTYTPTAFNGENKQSAYDAWLADQKAQYNTANSAYSGYKTEQDSAAQAYYSDQYSNWLRDQQSIRDKASSDVEAYNNTQSVATPKPFMPNGAPNAGDIMAEELFKLYGLDGRYDVSDKPSLSEYNPLKSDWNGSVNLDSLMKGLFEGLMGGRSSKVDPAKQFESPQYGLLAKSNVNPQEAADPFKSANNQWQRTVDLKPKEYESSYLDNYVDPYVPKLEKQIGMPSLDIAAPSMFANQGLLSGMAQQSSKNETANSKSIVDQNRESVSEAINNARDRVKGLSWKQLA